MRIIAELAPGGEEQPRKSLTTVSSWVRWRDRKHNDYGEKISMVAIALPYRLERTIERIRRFGRSLRVKDDQEKRRRLAATMIRRGAELEHFIDERAGYATFPPGMIHDVASAVEFAQQTRAERRQPADKKKGDYRSTIVGAKRYEDGPQFFDLALSDDVLQITSEYLREIPILTTIKLWHSPCGRDATLMGSQLYHRDEGQWLRRGLKFLICMDKVDASCGPFIFLQADVSKRVSEALGSMRYQDHISDELVYRHARPSDAHVLIGEAGTGAVIDSFRCFHYGARSQGSERLMLQLQFARRVDCIDGGRIRRSAGFVKRFGDDPIRKLVIPNAEQGLDA